MIDDDSQSICSAMALYAQAAAMVLGGAALGFVWGLAELMARS